MLKEAGSLYSEETEGRESFVIWKKQWRINDIDDTMHCIYLPRLAFLSPKGLYTFFLLVTLEVDRNLNP
jgi:hypothetical protein